MSDKHTTTNIGQQPYSVGDTYQVASADGRMPITEVHGEVRAGIVAQICDESPDYVDALLYGDAWDVALEAIPDKVTRMRASTALRNERPLEPASPSVPRPAPRRAQRKAGVGRD